jgi:hypothetical protein
MLRFMPVASLLGAFAFAPAAFACRCAEPSLAAAYRRAGAVALVKVIEVKPGSGETMVNTLVAASEAWKSDVPSRFTVVSGEDCIYPMNPGEQHLLFLTRTGEILSTYRCRGSRPADQAKPALEWMKRHAKPAQVRSTREK